ncbi:penicillin-binding protein 2 [Petroclostridium sp. X23]|uniref:penicillin-binding protein 2 n=1 Tax=Petroclostridium sp. X23 TaxID=3045146 RepID=UPI0024AE13F4|nr:penicillin-binding protein 2 [Petroclostridium sp. X23]WHH61051.1 penicillin-binding protein 2 [Petroclostridium sp. X23]
MVWERIKSRYSILSILIILLGIVFIYRLLQIQIVHGQEYREQSERRLFKSKVVKAPRGEVYDTYGRPLATNRMGFSIQIHKINNSDNELNDILLNLTQMLELNGDTYNDTLPISDAPFEFTFSDSESSTKQQKEDAWKEAKEFDIDASAEDIINQLKKKYKISDQYSDLQLRKILGVRYEMKTRGFGANAPYTLSTNIGTNTVMQLEERHLEFPGVSVVTEPIRYYPNGSLAAHILGRVGIIYEEEYKELKEEGYGMNDILGKEGMEKILESYLKGKDGVSSIEQDIQGKTTSVLESKLPIPGNNAFLTIDTELQTVAEKALRDTINIIRENALEEIKRDPSKALIGEDANSGAVVAMDVNTGGILAMATYPTYDPARFNEDYNMLLNDPLKPMLNRAISGAYPPGSTFKMLTAVAGLEEGIITPETRIQDKGKYTYYEKNGPICWIYQSRYGYRTHGFENVSDALRDSCNYFFYDVGRRLTIDKLYEYGKKFGLGQLTGIELPGESRGIFYRPEYKEFAYKKPYQLGETLYAAIGQMHIFTPLQMVSYISTLANGGTRYKPHLIKKVKTYDDGKSIKETETEILSKVDIKPNNLKAILEGMRNVTQQDGTASHIFKDFPVTVAGKTGTAELGIEGVSNNGVFVGFAPYDNPQIAVVVVIEHGKSGGNTAPVAREIFAQYLGLNNKKADSEFPVNQLVR